MLRWIQQIGRMSASGVLPGLLATLLAAGCTGAEAPAKGGAPSATLAVPAELIGAVWQAKMAVAQNRAPFEGRDPWIRYFQGQRSTALAGFASENDKPALARLHGEYAAIYRQMAMTAAWATLHTWGTDAQPADPAAMPLLVGIAGAMLHEAQWSEKLKSLDGAPGLPPELAAQQRAWQGWVAGGSVWPPPLDGIAGLPDPAQAQAGSLPEISGLPHWRLPYQGEAGELGVAHPAALLAFARWHEAAAALADPASAAAVARLIDPWRLPGEPRSTTGSPVFADSLLFMSPYMTGGDVAFVAALSADPANNDPAARYAALEAAIQAHRADSPVAAIVAHCRIALVQDEKPGSGWQMGVDCVQSQAALLVKAVEAKMDEVAGAPQDFHRSFAEYARVGVLRSAALAAAAMGDREGMGLLRINALDRSMGNTRDPLFVSSVSAWDASNRNSLRCADLLHELESNVPGMEAARLPVDALQIRIGRNSAPAGAMH